METVEVRVKDRVILLDKEDVALFEAHRWHIYHLRHKKPYVRLNRCKETPKSEYFHRMILGITDPKVQIDHANGDSLDNRKCNLRVCRKGADNAINRPQQKNNTTGYKGVFLRKEKYYQSKPKYRAAIRVNQKLIHVGHFSSAKEAALAYNEAAVKYFGEFAWLNKVDE